MDIHAHEDRMARRLSGHLLLLLPFLLGALFVIAGCDHEGARSTIAPVSDFGRSIQNIYVQIFWWTVGIFIVVESILLYAILKYRVKTGSPSHETPEQVHGHTGVEIAWTILPAVILVLIAIPTIRTIFAIAAEPPANALQIKVSGQQWFWHFEYPDLGIRTANELHVPLGRPVSIALHSNDVIHSFWVPRIGGKRDLVPGRTNRISFTADKAGYYPGQCAEFCGDSHALMRMDLIVDRPEEFERWVEAQKEPAVAPTEPLASEGATAFLSTGCIACHRIAGTPAQSPVGPDLTHVGSRMHLASGILKNTPENMARWIRDPQSVKPGAKMVKLPVTDEQVKAIVAYLQGLK